MKMKIKKDTTAFLTLICDIKDPVQLAGLLKIMGIETVDSNKEPIPFESIVDSIASNYQNSSRTRRRNLRTIVEAAIRPTED